MVVWEMSAERCNNLLSPRQEDFTMFLCLSFGMVEAMDGWRGSIVYELLGCVLACLPVFPFLFF